MESSALPRLAAAAQLLRASTDAFVGFLSALPEETAIAAPPDRWSPAAHGYHVAMTNQVFGGVLDGSGPLEAFTGTSEFPDDRWSFSAPPVIAAPSIIIPPAGVSKEAAVRFLIDRSDALIPAMHALEISRAEMCVRLPWGVISLVQMCEWAAGHTLRHLAQVGRELQQDAARARAV